MALRSQRLRTRFWTSSGREANSLRLVIDLSPNEKVEQLAANRLTIPQDAIASLLQRLVRPRAVRNRLVSRPPSTASSLR